MSAPLGQAIVPLIEAVWPAVASVEGLTQTITLRP